MKLWRPRVEYIATVVWESIILPDEAHILPFQLAIDMKYYGHKNNMKTRTKLRDYIRSNGVNERLKKMAERGEVIINGDSVRRVA